MHAQSYRNIGIYFWDAVKYLQHFLCGCYFFSLNLTGFYLTNFLGKNWMWDGLVFWDSSWLRCFFKYFWKMICWWKWYFVSHIPMWIFHCDIHIMGAHISYRKEPWMINDCFIVQLLVILPRTFPTYSIVHFIVKLVPPTAAEQIYSI